MMSSKSPIGWKGAQLTPKVSVIIPTFNRSVFVKRAIESVLAQTCGDCELIVVDDGSTDDTADVIGAYGNRVHYMHQPNSGVSAARNRGLHVASGELIGFLDSDDLWAPAKIAHQVNALDALGVDCGACLTDCMITGATPASTSAFARAGLQVDSEYGELADPFKYILQRRPAIWIPSLLVRRSVLEEIGEFDECLTTTEDTDFIFRLALTTRFCYVSRPLVTIDADRQHSHLTDFHHARSTELHARNVYRCVKWLRRAEGNPVVQAAIRDTLRKEYYEWAITDIYGLAFSKAFERARQVRLLGDSPATIAHTFARRAAAKVARSVRT
jgi:glycosyltransferase involved in cell wall biosynthesis